MNPPPYKELFPKVPVELFSTPFFLFNFVIQRAVFVNFFARKCPHFVLLFLVGLVVMLRLCCVCVCASVCVGIGRERGVFIG